MFNFTFWNPTKILFGKGRIADVAREVERGRRVMVLYGGGSVLRNGIMDQVRAALEGRDALEFGGIEPNPSYETLMKAVSIARAENVEFLLAVGGGSVIDGTKFVAAAVPFEGDPWDILAKGAKVGAALPFGTVLTLPATGSEMNSGAVVTRRESSDKLFFNSPRLFPKFSVLDPDVTFTLPPRQVANGIVDAFAHVMEQYLTYPANAAVQDRFAEGLLLTLVEYGPKALASADLDVRANVMWAATLALNGLIGAGVPQDWTTHMIGHEITALYGLDHAQTLAIVMPAVLAHRCDHKRAKLEQYAERVWGLAGDDRAERAIERTRAFFESLGVPTKLPAYGVGERAVEGVVAQLERHGMTALGERRDVTLDDCREILAACL